MDDYRLSYAYRFGMAHMSIKLAVQALKGADARTVRYVVRDLEATLADLAALDAEHEAALAAKLASL